MSFSLSLPLRIPEFHVQIVSGFLSLTCSLMRDCRMHLSEYHNSANIINYIRTALAFVIIVMNLLISTFDSSPFRYYNVDLSL